MRVLVQQAGSTRATAKAFGLPLRHLRDCVGVGSPRDSARDAGFLDKTTWHWFGGYSRFCGDA
jgi:hypothetical protein